MRKSSWTCRAAVAAMLALTGLCSVGSGNAFAQAAPPEQTPPKANTAAGPQRYDLAIAIAVSIGLSCMGAGYAVGRVGAAALGAASEKPELLTRGLLFVALAEGIAIYGLLISILLWIKL